MPGDRLLPNYGNPMDPTEHNWTNKDQEHNEKILNWKNNNGMKKNHNKV